MSPVLVAAIVAGLAYVGWYIATHTTNTRTGGPVLGGTPAAEVHCVPSGVTAFSCTVKSTGTAPARACWDIVVRCGATKHVAHHCSDSIPPNGTESYAVRDFDKPISPIESCDAVKLESLVVQ